jgi:hypothetical protein
VSFAFFRAPLNRKDEAVYFSFSASNPTGGLQDELEPLSSCV